MCSSVREFGFKVPVLARSDGEVVDGHLRIKAAPKLRLTEIPVILCDERTEAQVKAFRLLVNRSVTWADRNEELLAIELQEINAADFNLDLTGSIPARSTNYSLSPMKFAPMKRRRSRPFPLPAQAASTAAGQPSPAT